MSVQLSRATNVDAMQSLVDQLASILAIRYEYLWLRYC